MQPIAPHNHPMYKFSDPKRVGPGSWFMFLLMAAHAKSRSERAMLCKNIRLFCEFFQCGECSGHCKKYLTDNNPEDTILTDRGLFDWVVTFMNAVNHRLGKPGYDGDYLYRMVTEQGFEVCEKDCGGKEETKQQQQPPKYVATRGGRNVGSFRLARLGEK